MNHEFILLNLREARETLSRTIGEVENRPDYGYAEFKVAITNLYHHINLAWNARDESVSAPAESSEEEFERWGQFPSDLDLSS